MSDGMTQDGQGEAALLEQLREALGEAAGGWGVLRGIGDDAAVLRPPPADALVATVDMVVEGQHFRLRGPGAVPLADVGWRALAVSLSDCAAMGARPLWALCSVGVPCGMGTEALVAVYRGMAELARAYGVAVVGGNLARVPERLALDVCVLGHAPQPLLRAGARLGDLVLLTGRLGAAAAGRAVAEAGGLEGWTGGEAAELTAAHRRPVPRVREGLVLGGLPRGMVHAVCDVSDGLVHDLAQLVPPGATAVLWEDQLPVPAAVRAAAAKLGTDPLQWALYGGEDYELLLAVDPAALEAVTAALRTTEAGVRSIGVLAAAEAESPVALAPAAGGARRPLPVRGWDPFAAQAPCRPGGSAAGAQGPVGEQGGDAPVGGARGG